METSDAYSSSKKRYGGESIKSNVHISRKRNQIHSSITLFSEIKTMTDQSSISKSNRNQNHLSELWVNIFSGTVN
jgi:hypothetical protein